MMSRNREKVFFTILGVPTFVCLAAFLWITSILLTGIGTIRLDLITTSVLQGGFFEMIVGTTYLLLGATGIAGPVGVFAAIYLTEYARQGRLTHIINQTMNNLAGMPTILIGLFGYTFFCRQLGLGVSLAAGWLTLALMELPIVIRGTEETVKMVPKSFKEASLALGASKWETIKSIIIPSATPGIISSILLSMARVAGETAAILFTSCVLVTRSLPSSPFEPVMALAFNLFVKIVALGETPDKVFGVALVLFLLVISLASTGIALRIHYRRKQPWLR